MKIDILGCSGGQTPTSKTTSFIINHEIAIDAGSIASSLNIDQQANIDAVFISHAHLDHVVELPYLIDNTFSKRRSTLKVYASGTVIEAIRTHILNDVIWPDFSKINLPTNIPCVEFVELRPNEPVKCLDYVILPVEVNHAPGSFGFLINDRDSTVVFTQDTAPTEEIWNISRSYRNISAIFTEVSFPNEELELAKISKHLTPQCLAHETTKMPMGVPVYISHLKPALCDKIKKQLGWIKEKLKKQRHIVILDDRDTVLA